MTEDCVGYTMDRGSDVVQFGVAWRAAIPMLSAMFWRAAGPSMKIKIERAGCAGHARCNAVAPHLYELDDNGYIATDGFAVAPGDEDLARKGARACPERVIVIVEDQG